MELHEAMKKRVEELQEENTKLKEVAIEWNEGFPKQHFFDGDRANEREWFLAVLKGGGIVALTSLPENYTYDFKTAEDTYIMKELVTKWSLLPGSQWKRDFAASMTDKSRGLHG